MKVRPCFSVLEQDRSDLTETLHQQSKTKRLTSSYVNVLKFEYLFSISILEDALTERNVLDFLKKALTFLESATSSPPDAIRDVYFLAVTVLVKLQVRSVLCGRSATACARIHSLSCWSAYLVHEALSRRSPSLPLPNKIILSHGNTVPRSTTV